MLAAPVGLIAAATRGAHDNSLVLPRTIILELWAIIVTADILVLVLHLLGQHGRHATAEAPGWAP